MKTEQNISLQLKVSRFFIAFLLTFVVTTTLHAQINDSKGIPSYTNYIVGDLNLAGQQVWNVNQDKLGYIYVGTSSGMQKFDGVNWELLRSPIQDFNTNVRATHLSSNGTFYYGSIDDFGYIAHDSTGNTVLTSIIEWLPEEILFNDIWSIREVAGKIYFQSRSAIFIYTPDQQDKENSIQIWKPDTEFMYAFALNERFYTHQMNLGLYQEKNDSLELIPGSEFLGQDRVQVLLPFNNPEEFLVGAFAGGLFHYDGNDFNPFPTQIDSLLQDRSLYKALALPDDTYALSVLGHGFFLINQQGEVLSQYTTQNSITDQSVYSFHLDTYDNLWVGTNNGLSKIELFSPITRFDSDQYELRNVLSLDAYGEDLYIGNSVSVLYLDQDDGNIKQVEGFTNSQVFDLVADGNQVLASGTGIHSIQGNKATLIESTERFQIVQILISERHPGYIFIGGGGGIHVFKRERASNGYYSYESIGPISAVERDVYSLVEDVDGEIWGGTQAGILYRIILSETASGNVDLSNANVSEFSDEDGIRGLSGTTVNVNGKVYTSGIDGFYYFDKTSERFVRDSVFSFSEEVADINLDTYGLGSNHFGDVFLDFKGEKRLAKLQPDGSYTLQAYPFNLLTASFSGSNYTEPNGVLWFGTNEGLLRLDPNSDYKIDHKIPLYFSSVTSGENELELPEYFDDEYPKLQYQGNKISFNYIAPFFIKEQMTTYQSYLEGFDENWEDWENKTFREFTNLPHGTYTFRVRARNVFNTVSDEIEYSFVVLPPWYATWWAYALYFFGFGFLVFGLVKVQTKRVLAKEKEKSREKELEQAKEIEKAYENLKAAQDQLVQQEKLASLGQLTAGIAHEIKNPLNFVNNFSDLSVELVEEVREELRKAKSEFRSQNSESPLEGSAEAERRRGVSDEATNHDLILDILDDIAANLRKIHEHGSRADSIVKSMLQHSRGGSGSMEPTNLNALVKEFVNLAFHGMRAGKNPMNVDIEFDLDEQIGEVPLIAEDFSRVIVNLCNNAFDAMREKQDAGGRGQDVENYEPKLTVRTLLQKGIANVEVKDNGPGIPEEMKEKIMQPFFTTKKGTEGTGLGLYITNDIVKAHGGMMDIDSSKERGSRFIIRLPKK
jgi:signal transduction histidine kinase/ligand-binding sensor domain-containing protein